MDIKEAIVFRRSIRRYKPDEIPRDALLELLDAARLAPSGTNHQPWRFVVVRDPAVKAEIRAAAFDQKFLTQAPIVLACCADLSVYGRDTRRRVEELAASGALNPDRVKEYPGFSAPMDAATLERYQSQALFNVALAMENIVLRAVSLGLGTCIVQHMSARRVASVLGLPETLIVGALMAVGYPAEDPRARPRDPVEGIIFKEV
jgi:nitroreductase